MSRNIIMYESGQVRFYRILSYKGGSPLYIYYRENPEDKNYIDFLTSPEGETKVTVPKFMLNMQHFMKL